ncbi:hypothetical protein ABH926_005865 [Catenulispora sp. GP43]|uniref:hypothetical protein n=1 Tax=Catenulispora sp. GP43 TaxID=3156263 RepID=UPI003516B2A7
MSEDAAVDRAGTKHADIDEEESREPAFAEAEAHEGADADEEKEEAAPAENGFRTVTYTSPGFDSGAEDREDAEDTVTGSDTEARAEAEAEAHGEAQARAEADAQAATLAGAEADAQDQAETEAEPGFDTAAEPGFDTAVQTESAAIAATATTAAPAADTLAEPLMGLTSAEAFIDRWSSVQVTFVEDPHRSVTEADALLTEVLTAYQDAVEQRRAQIAAAGADGAGDTEDLRLALLEYRTIITAMVGG